MPGVVMSMARTELKGHEPKEVGEFMGCGSGYRTELWGFRLRGVGMGWLCVGL